MTAVLGTHTHVQTSDARVQRGGTAAITDVGMTGPHDSVIGVKADSRSTGCARGCRSASRPPRAASGSRAPSSSATSTGRATAIEAVRVPFPDEHDEQGDEDEVADEHERRRQRVELAREVPVARREPELRQRRARRARSTEAREAAHGRARAGRAGTSQIRNCGESTFPSATKATSAAALQRTSSSRRRRPPQPDPGEHGDLRRG